MFRKNCGWLLLGTLWLGSGFVQTQGKVQWAAGYPQPGNGAAGAIPAVKIEGTIILDLGWNLFEPKVWILDPLGGLAVWQFVNTGPGMPQPNGQTIVPFSWDFKLMQQVEQIVADQRLVLNNTYNVVVIALVRNQFTGATAYICSPVSQTKAN
jgi:hypothetical protein